MVLRIFKEKRLLLLQNSGNEILRAPVALGRNPAGAKSCEGDGKTPEGIYHICLIKENGKYGHSLGLDYPSPQDAALALAERRINPQTHAAIMKAHLRGCRPPWGTPLGGEIYLHAGGAQSDWTEGCIALEKRDMETLFAFHANIDCIEICP